MIDPHTAARIAREHGLTLSDARAIAAMARNEHDAHELAQAFAPTGVGGPTKETTR